MASTAVAAGDDEAGPRKGTPPPPPAAPEQGLRCPRCDSPNTKFCYYNNYSLSQPRHFCKTCRRYWTKGGALRNVPVGGGCRKNKRSRSAASRLSLNLPAESANADPARLQGFLGGGGPASSPHGGEFQGAVGMLPLPRMAAGQQYAPFGEWASADVSGGSNGAIASSIESLSFINQDLHWKLQQQRVATMFLGPPSSSAPHAVEGAAFLQMAGDQSGMESVPAATSSWFMETSYALPPPAAATTSSNINSVRSSGGGGEDNATSNSNNCGSAIPSWGDISTFAMLP